MDSVRLQAWEPLFDKAMLAIDSLPPHLPKLEWTIGGGTVLIPVSSPVKPRCRYFYHGCAIPDRLIPTPE